MTCDLTTYSTWLYTLSNQYQDQCMIIHVHIDDDKNHRDRGIYYCLQLLMWTQMWKIMKSAWSIEHVDHIALLNNWTNTNTIYVSLTKDEWKTNWFLQSLMSLDCTGEWTTLPSQSCLFDRLSDHTHTLSTPLATVVQNQMNVWSIIFKQVVCTYFRVFRRCFW